ncbi:MAG: hypothetical protein JNK60_21990 [Acidobacteria bacterium]|nr:hypothetical protein [Acidobacteriota bacterium]
MTFVRSQPGRVALLLLGATLLGTGCASTRAFRDAQQEEAREHWDLAVLGYEKALVGDPDNARIKIALSQAKMRAAQAHLMRGRIHRSAGALDLAKLEYEQSVALDPVNDTALQEFRRLNEEIEQRRLASEGGSAVEKAKRNARGQKARQPMLDASSTKVMNLTIPQDQPIKKIYTTLGSAAGINILFDPQLKDDRYTIDLRDLTFQKALETLMRQAGHFYKILDDKTILVAQDTPQNRKEYEDLVIQTFFLSNGDVKDVSAMVRGILDLRRIGTIPQLNAIVIRDTADKVAVAEKIIEINDKSKAEVIVDVELLQINTKKLTEIGTRITDTYSGVYTGGGTSTSTGGSGGTGGSTTTTLLPWSELFKIGLKDFSFNVPAITFNFIKNNSDAELLAKPQLRIAEGEKAQLTIGDRVPIPVTTVNTTQAIGQTGVVPITSFQYQDVGIKIDIEPRVHHNKEVTLKLTVEVSNLNGTVSGPNGQDQPIIGTRTITSTIRLKDGETNFLAGLKNRTKAVSKTGLPFLGDLPIVGALFSSTKKDFQETDLFLTLTPRIIRAPQITEEDLLPVWVGTENNVSFSGPSTPRLESPNAQGSPFDGTPPPAAPSQPRPGQLQSSPSIPQGSAPNDPFRRAPAPVPEKPATPPTNPQRGPGFSSLTPAGDGTKTTLTASGETLPAERVEEKDVAVVPVIQNGELPLVLLSSGDEIVRGGTAIVTLETPVSLKDLSEVELTLEWNPEVLEITALAPGAWKDGPMGLDVRFDADRMPGRARVRLARPSGTGLPDGALAAFAFKGRGPGASLLRASAGGATSRSGPLRPRVEPLTVSVLP